MDVDELERNLPPQQLRLENVFVICEFLLEIVILFSMIWDIYSTIEMIMLGEAHRNCNIHTIRFTILPF